MANRTGMAVVMLLVATAACLFLAGWTVKTVVKDGLQTKNGPSEATAPTPSRLATAARPSPSPTQLHDELRDVTHLATAVASSHLPPDGNSVYIPGNAIDGNLATSWQPNAKRTRGVGEHIDFNFPSPIHLAQIEIANGFQHSWGGQDLFAMNARLHEAELLVGIWSARYTFESERRGYQSIRLDPPLVTQSVRIAARSVHRGTRWPDLAISEVRFKALQPASAE